MAARTVKIRHDDQTRAKIKASQLINRLQGHVLAKVKLEASQIKAIEILLRKTLPDLSTVTLEGGDRPLQLETLQRTIVDPNTNR